MPYIGTSPSNGVRRVHTYTATAGQTNFTGAGSEGATLSYKDTTFVDVFQNGVLLGSADYTATSGTSIVLAQAASVDDLVVVIAYDVFSVADTVSKADGGTFDGNVTMAGTLAVTGNQTNTGNVTVNGAFTSQGINDDANAVAVTIDANENVGINNTNPDQFVTTSKVVAIQGTANNSGSASLHLNGNTDGSGYYNTQVFAVSGITSATEITRYTGTGNNGFRAYFKIIATGHTAAVNNGINIKEYYYDGDTNAPVQISSYVATNAPVIAFNNATNDMLIVTLSSSNGTNEFRGVLKIDAMIPIDFTSPASTYTIS